VRRATARTRRRASPRACATPAEPTSGSSRKANNQTRPRTRTSSGGRAGEPRGSARRARRRTGPGERDLARPGALA
jgi:hypothetical protein